MIKVSTQNFDSPIQKFKMNDALIIALLGKNLKRLKERKKAFNVLFRFFWGLEDTKAEFEIGESCSIVSFLSVCFAKLMMKSSVSVTFETT